MSSIRFISVCSGIESASVAWNPLGWHATQFSEIEPFPCSVLRQHYPHTPNHGDMNNFREWPDDDAIDLVCGGTPCQSFSVAGLRAGLADARGNLMLVYAAIAAKYRPRWLVWENVPGVLSSNAGRDFGSFLWLLGQCGYGFAYRILDAQYFGLAQRRKRVYVVGHLGDWRRAAAVLFERHCMQWDHPPRRKAGQETARALDTGTDEDGDLDGLVPDIIGQAISAKWAKGSSGPAGDECHNLIAFDPTQATSATNRSQPKTGDACHPLAAGMHAPVIAFDCTASGMNGFGIGEVTTPMRVGTGNHMSAHQAVMSDMQVRRLTPRECERLQGFPDDYTLVRHRGREASDGARYRALGNAWAVPVVRWIGQRIEAVEAIA